MDKIVKIANGQGFWGDSGQAPIDLVEKADISIIKITPQKLLICLQILKINFLEEF